MIISVKLNERSEIKMKYEAPEMKMLALSAGDVITTSGGGNLGIEGGEITGGGATGNTGGAGDED